MRERRDRFYEQVTTSFGPETEFEGTLEFTQPLRIEGAFEGMIQAQGLLHVAENARVIADIQAESVVVAGYVEGDISAVSRIEVRSGGVIKGNIKTTHLRIEDGVSLEGKCEMIRDPESIDIFSAALAKLKSTIQNV